MIEARFWLAVDCAEPVAMLPLPAPRGDRGEKAADRRLCSGVMKFPAVRLAEFVRGSGGPMDLAFAVRTLVNVRVVSKLLFIVPSVEVRVESALLPAFDIRLGRRFWPGREA